MRIDEFLLARIAEDERVAELSDTHGTGRFPTPWWQRLANGAGQYPVMASVRLHAECDAKRRIVDQYLTALRRGNWATCKALEAVLPVLALPYADHPDYDPDWRPTE